jgi:GntR family transcriptional regulator
MIKRSPSLVDQVQTHLRQRINNAEFDDGRIPSETVLAGELSVSRNTVRDALSRLEMEGLIYRRQGAGTFVNRANLLVKTRLEEIVPYTQLIAEQGYHPSVQVISVETRPVEAALARQLGLTPPDTVLEIQKLFWADDTPVIFTCSAIPSRLIKQPCTAADFVGATYQQLAPLCGETLAYYVSDIVPLLAPPWLAEYLQLSPSQPALLSFSELGYNQSHQPIISATSYYRHDLLRLRLVRRNQ